MQAEVGIDIPSDGEVGKPSFAGYITERLGGLEATVEAPKSSDNPMNYPILNEEFPGFMAQYNAMYRTIWMPPSIPRDLVDAAVERTRNERVIVVDKITYQGQEEIQRDLAVFKEALEGLQFEEAFVPAATPSRSDEDPEHIYPSEQAYLYAVADAMREEYKAIVDAGFVVQLDLGLPARNQVLPGNPRPTWEELRRASEMQVEAYNHALQGIPEDRVRYHLCWGSMNTPHTSDIPLKEIVDLILKINAQAYSIEAANPRHEHEWMVWQDVKLPGRQDPDPGHHQPPDQRRRAPGAGRLADQELRQRGRQGERHRQHGLRLLPGLEHDPGPSGGPVGQAEGAGRRRRAGQQGALGAPLDHRAGRTGESACRLPVNVLSILPHADL